MPQTTNQRNRIALTHQPECVCTNLRRATRAISQFYDAAIASSGLKITQFALLRSVERNAPAPIHRLAEEMDLDRTTLARNLMPLERDGLIVLASGRDKRVCNVALTAAGQAAIERALPLWRRAQSDIARRLGEGSIAHMRELAQRVTAAAKG
jgi:DNA-binding MarR family transcriptional regulator